MAVLCSLISLCSQTSTLLSPFGRNTFLLISLVSTPQIIIITTITCASQLSTIMEMSHRQMDSTINNNLADQCIIAVSLSSRSRPHKLMSSNHLAPNRPHHSPDLPALYFPGSGGQTRPQSCKNPNSPKPPPKPSINKPSLRNANPPSASA